MKDRKRTKSAREREIDELLQGIKDEKKVKVDDEVVPPAPQFVNVTTVEQEDEFKAPKASKKKRTIAREIRVLNQNEKPRKAVKAELEVYADQMVNKAIADAKVAAKQLSDERQLFNVMAAFINAADAEQQVVEQVVEPEHPTRFTLERGEAADLSQALHGIESHGDLNMLIDALDDIELAEQAAKLKAAREAELEAKASAFLAQQEQELDAMHPLVLDDLNVEEDWYTRLFMQEDFIHLFDQLDQDLLQAGIEEELALINEKQQQVAEQAIVTPVSMFTPPVASKVHELATSVRDLKKLVNDANFANQVNSINANLETPLYLAVVDGNLKAVEFLLPHCTINTILQRSNVGVNSCELITFDHLLRVQRDKDKINKLLQNRLTELNYVPGNEAQAVVVPNI